VRGPDILNIKIHSGFHCDWRPYRDIFFRFSIEKYHSLLLCNPIPDNCQLPFWSQFAWFLRCIDPL
jgi:hypothetical protein